MDPEKNWDLIGYVLASKNRFMVLDFLSKKEAIPSNISDKLDIRIGHISNLLKGLSKRGLIKCMNPNLKKGRIYKITTLGLKLIAEINKMDLNK